MIRYCSDVVKYGGMQWQSMNIDSYLHVSFLKKIIILLPIRPIKYQEKVKRFKK